MTYSFDPDQCGRRGRRYSLTEPFLHRRPCLNKNGALSHPVNRVGNSRVLLETVIRAFQDGKSPESIVNRYSTLSLSNIQPDLTSIRTRLLSQQKP